MSLGVRIACIALAGTVGAVGMLGHRRGGIAEPFAASGLLLAPGATRAMAIIGGFVIHVAWVAAASAVLAAFMQRDRRTGASIVAAILAALVLVATIVVPAAMGGPLATLPMAERAVVCAVLAISLALGMRLAPGG
jgi:hypothetical protein